MTKAAARRAPTSPRKRNPADGERIPASEFKSHCLELLDRVRQSRRTIVVTKHGRPVARVVPYEIDPPSIAGSARGMVTYYGDIISPLDEPWEADAP